MREVLLQLVPVLKQMVEFLSKRLAAIVALGALFYFAPEMQLSMQILLSACVLAFIISETKLKTQRKLAAKVAPVAKMPAAKVVPMFLACLLLPFLAQADWWGSVKDQVDKLDLQAGPGLEAVAWKPFVVEECIVATAKIPKTEFGKVHFRIGTSAADGRSPRLVLAIARSMNDVVIRKDGDNNKVLLPSVGIWSSVYRVEEIQDDGTLGKIFKLSFGVNACYEY